MKKLSLLALVLIVGLPGCGKKQESARSVKKNTIEKYMDMPAEDELVEVDMSEVGDDEDDMKIYDVFNDLDADDEEEDDVDLDEDAMDIEATDETFNWIDAQTDDEFKKLYFSFNHYGIRADQTEAVSYDIEQVKQLIAESDSSAQPTIVIEGHACQEGTPAYNLALSEKRAKNVADLFVAAGIDRSAIKVVGRGQECPATVANGSREERAPNRRVEVRVIYT
jgi:outer membrane protein OmpA-like peptidoglycan-associated protein